MQVVSCEMIEAVGHENLPAYFRAISGFLKPGGQAVIQVCNTCFCRALLLLGVLSLKASPKICIQFAMYLA